jgi:hypothetical protein
MYAGRAGLAESRRVEAARQLGADAFSVHHDTESDTVLAAWRARMLEGAVAEAWPEPLGPAVEVLRDEALRETSLLAAEQTLPAAAGELAWRAPTEPDANDGDEAAAAVGLAKLRRSLSPHRACPVRPAALVYR